MKNENVLLAAILFLLISFCLINTPYAFGQQVAFPGAEGSGGGNGIRWADWSGPESRLLIWRVFVEKQHL